MREEVLGRGERSEVEGSGSWISNRPSDLGFNVNLGKTNASMQWLCGRKGPIRKQKNRVLHSTIPWTVWLLPPALAWLPGGRFDKQGGSSHFSRDTPRIVEIAKRVGAPMKSGSAGEEVEVGVAVLRFHSLKLDWTVVQCGAIINL